MNIYGLMKTTLLDYPGHVAATIFTGGCNFRCPFCHNGDLVGAAEEPPYTEDMILEFLKKRSGVLDGICISGGEPTLQPDLESFIRKARELGYLIKLDTNGYRPDILKDLCQKGLLDFVAMDIKAAPANYSLVAGLAAIQIERIEESAAFLKMGTIPYEFRTTVVKELHTKEDFRIIGPWLKGVPHYYLQNFTDSDGVITPGFTSCTKEELLEYLAILHPYIPEAALRGIDY